MTTQNRPPFACKVSQLNGSSFLLAGAHACGKYDLKYNWTRDWFPKPFRFKYHGCRIANPVYYLSPRSSTKVVTLRNNEHLPYLHDGRKTDFSLFGQQITLATNQFYIVISWYWTHFSLRSLRNGKLDGLKNFQPASWRIDVLRHAEKRTL